jgi:hypothetical protein
MEKGNIGNIEADSLGLISQIKTAQAVLLRDE